MTLTLRLHASAALLSVFAVLPGAHAQGVATERELSPVVVGGTRAPLDPNLPASTFSTTREALSAQSFLNTEDALIYAPGTTVRKRFIGDRNANLGGRSFGTTQPARGLAYVDGYLISNFLGRFDAPRWSIVSPEEIARVDVLYGPFSALYPGNSIGTTVAITTRTPQQAEASATAQIYRQTHDDFGLKRDYSNHQESAYAGTRVGRLGLTVTLNRMAYESQPMGYAAATAAAGSVAGLPVVSGAVANRDPSGAQRMIVGATGMQDGVQEQAKIKLAYDFTPALQGDVLYARWWNDYRVDNQTLLVDAGGNEVWRGFNSANNGAVNIGGSRYTVPVMAPQRGLEEHEQLGGRLRTRHATGWNYSVQWSRYQTLQNSTRQSNLSDPLSATAAAGTDTLGDGTGWRTFELQGTRTPAAGEAHALTFGYHRNDYTLVNRVFALTNWNDANTRTSERQNYFGKTEIQALYAQDAWRLHPDWTLTLGARTERFRAHDGSQFDIQATGSPQVNFAERRLSATSPKLSLAHALDDQWLLRASWGRGVRFPTVSELFQGTRNGTQIFNNDPNLRPEKSDAAELSAIRESAVGTLRISVFEDDIEDAIFRQVGTVGATTVQTVQNVDRVRTRGVEFAWQGSDVWVRGFDLQASLTLARSKTLANDAVPESVGKNWPRVPKVRASLLGAYRSGPWLASLGVRHEGTQYGELDNSDIHDDTPGAVSSFTVGDLKFGYTPAQWASMAVGVDNVTDRRYYVGPHPYPGRTLYAELRLAY